MRLIIQGTFILLITFSCSNGGKNSSLQNKEPKVEEKKTKTLYELHSKSRVNTSSEETETSFDSLKIIQSSFFSTQLTTYTDDETGEKYFGASYTSSKRKEGEIYIFEFKKIVSSKDSAMVQFTDTANFLSFMKERAYHYVSEKPLSEYTSEYLFERNP